jgi:peptide/nickel transport system permease protein
MTTYIIRRIFHGIIVMAIVTFLVFITLRLLPGDPLLIFLSMSETDMASEEELEKLRKEYGLDKPIMVQYVVWVKDILHGDLGESITYGDDVSELMGKAMPITLYLSALTLVVYIFVGIPAGVVCAVRWGKWSDTIVTLLANIGITVPSFWLGIILIYLFGLQLGWFPIQGYTSPFDDFWLSTRKLVMPVFCLAIGAMGSTARQTRSSMLEVVRQDYVRTAWAKGLSERTIIRRHVLKNGIIPVVTLLGLTISRVIGGSTLIETVFNIPGMGRLLVNALFNQDYPVAQGITLLFCVVVTVVNLVVDISYGWLDPRIRLT